MPIWLFTAIKFSRYSREMLYTCVRNINKIACKFSSVFSIIYLCYVASPRTFGLNLVYSLQNITEDPETQIQSMQSTHDKVNKGISNVDHFW